MSKKVNVEAVLLVTADGRWEICGGYDIKDEARSICADMLPFDYEGPVKRYRITATVETPSVEDVEAKTEEQ